MKKIIFILSLSYILSGCGVPQADYDELLAQNKSLEAQVDELMNGEDRFSKEILSAEEALAKRAEAEEKEKKRIENLSNTGIWQVSHYVDEFGEPTQKGVIRNLNLIYGLFSNSATQNSELSVRLLIETPKNIDIILYEYASNNPVKSYSPDKYRVLVQAADGERHKLNAINYGDRLSFGPQHSKKIYDTLVLGGEVKFYIVEEETPTTQYSFSIKNSDYIDNAVRLMAEKSKNK